MYKQNIKTNPIGHLIALLTLFYSCLSKPSEDWRESGRDTTITVSVRMSGTSNSIARALSAEDEYYVETIDVLLFNDKNQYIRRKFVNTTTSHFNYTGSFVLSLQEGIYNMVILANARSIVNAAAGSLQMGASKASVLSALVLQSDDKWITDRTQAGYRHIPMWGETGIITVSADNENRSVSATLLRMLVRIDVNLSETARNVFTLSSVRLFNYKDRGSVAPGVNINWTTTPTIPAGAVRPTPQGNNPHVYTVTNGFSLLNSIYTFEAPRGSSSDFLNNTCLVVGGRFEGDLVDTYYRIDFRDNQGNYLHLLRNHHYRVTIRNVKGSGLPTPELAFKSHPVNIVATVQDWIYSKLDHIDIEEMVRLNVSSALLHFSSAENTGRISIFTDHPDGWTIDKVTTPNGAIIPNNGWLRLDQRAGAANTTTYVALTVTENVNRADDNPPAARPRSAVIHLRAGFATYIIRVEQAIQYFPATHTGWAGSNIFWDGTRMTFDGVGVTIRQNYQGLFFQWGSLWGMAPNGENFSAWGNTTVYRLAINRGTGTAPFKHIPTSGITYLTLPRINDNLPTNAAQSDRPADQRHFLYEVHDPANGIGDICRLLTDMGWAPPGRWRMPTREEMAGNYTRVPASGGYSVVISTSAEGRHSITSGRTRAGTTAFFPANGLRSWDRLPAGQLRNPGLVGNYWTATPGTNNTGTVNRSVHMSFSSSTVNTANMGNNTADGFGVRCVRRD